MGTTLLLVGLGGGYKLYGYLKSEIGSAFKIPLQKIQDINQMGNDFKIVFENGEGKTDSYKIRKCEEKAFPVLEKLGKFII